MYISGIYGRNAGMNNSKWRLRTQAYAVSSTKNNTFVEKWQDKEMVLGFQGSRYRELSLHLLFHNCLQLKIILILKRHILGWKIPGSFTVYADQPFNCRWNHWKKLGITKWRNVSHSSTEDDFPELQQHHAVKWKRSLESASLDPAVCSWENCSLWNQLFSVSPFTCYPNVIDPPWANPRLKVSFILNHLKTHTHPDTRTHPTSKAEVSNECFFWKF